MTRPPLVRRRRAPTDVQGPARSGEAGPRATGPLQRLLDGDGLLLQLARFAMTGGVASTVQVLLFLLLAPSGALVANVVAWAGSTALANELHRRRTFHADDRVGRLTAQVEGGGLALLGLGVTSGALALLAVVVPDAGSVVQALLVLALNAAVGFGRFVALRWAFVERPRTA